MKSSILTAALLSTLALSAVPAAADVGFGADVVSRYVWRGTDFGNAVSVRPGMSYSTGSVEGGAWSSWAINGGGANENDLEDENVPEGRVARAFRRERGDGARELVRDGRAVIRGAQGTRREPRDTGADFPLPGAVDAQHGPSAVAPPGYRAKRS